MSIVTSKSILINRAFQNLSLDSISLTSNDVEKTSNHEKKEVPPKTKTSAQIEDQELLYNWIYHQNKPIRLGRIMKACEGLMQDEVYSENEYKNRLYLLFFPLVKYGLVEFMGNDSYSMSPSVIITDKTYTIYTAINLPRRNINELMKQCDDYTINKFRIIRFTSNKDSMLEYCKEYNIPFIIPDPLNALKQIPSIVSMINILPTKDLTKRPNNYFRIGRGWKTVKDMTVDGIYKHGEDILNTRYFLIHGNYKKIPGRDTNPDYSFIAQCAQIALNNEKPLVYNQTTEELKIETIINIPIIVERVLRISSVFKENSVEYKEPYNVFPRITFKMYKELNRIFNNNIRVEQ